VPLPKMTDFCGGEARGAILVSSSDTSSCGRAVYPLYPLPADVIENGRSAFHVVTRAPFHHGDNNDVTELRELPLSVTSLMSGRVPISSMNESTKY